MVEFWRSSFVARTTSAEDAQRIEADGWDGQTFMDSQSLSGDPWVVMGAWAIATKRLKLAIGVTNPLTRHPAVTAAAAAMVQVVSGGRAVLGVGRGDSALAYLGYAPVTLKSFRQTLEVLQTLLRGKEVPFADHHSTADAPSLGTMSLGGRPSATRLQWLPEGLPKVPLDVAATGPKVIEMAATIADQVTFNVGAMPDRISWALDIARSARQRQGLGDENINYGAHLIVICHPDADAVAHSLAGGVTSFARFQVMQGKAVGPKSAADEENFEAIRQGYDMTRHAVQGSNKVKGGGLTSDFLKRFAIVGAPDFCVDRLLKLNALGIQRFVIVGPGYHPEARQGSGSLFLTEVVPAVRAALSAAASLR
jgi:5,10-methylenetetrahydromethanopterin reductase